MEENQTRQNRLLFVSILIILIVTLTPGDGKIAGNYFDKIIHFIVFLILSISICFKYWMRKNLIDILFWGILFGLLTEVLQQFVPGRNMEFYDGIADTLGVIIGFHLYRNRKTSIDKIIESIQLVF